MRFRHTRLGLRPRGAPAGLPGQAKGQFGLSEMLGDRKELVGSSRSYTRTDIRTTSAILRLLKLAFLSSQEPDPGGPASTARPTPTGGYVDDLARARSRRCASEFLQRRRPSKGPRRPSDRRRQEGAQEAQRRSAPGPAETCRRASSTNKQEAEDVAIQAAKELRLPVYYPAVRLARGGYASGERDYPAARAYKIRDRAKKRYDAYRLVLYAGEAGQYYGVQGTSWKSPPILDSPTETIKMRGRKYELFYDGDRLRLDRLAHAARRVLGLEHALAEADQRADAGDRALADADRDLPAVAPSRALPSPSP